MIFDLYNKVKGGLNILDESTFNSLRDAFIDGKNELEAFSEAGIKSNKVFSQYHSTIDATEMSYKGYTDAVKKSGTAMNFAAIKAKLLNAALNAGVMLAVSVAITALVKVIHNYVNQVEDAKKANDEFAKQFDELNSSLNQSKKTIESIAPRYNELSKYVNTLGTNVGLTKEEFEEYHNITQQIAEMYPSLVTGYDAQGNAIVNLKDALVELNEEFEKSKENAYWEQIGKAPEVLKNFNTMMNSNSEKSFSNQLKRYEKLLELFMGDYEEARDFLFNGVGDYYSIGLTDLGIGLDFEEKDMDRILAQIRNQIQSLNTEIEAETRKVTPLLEAYLNTNSDYNNFNSDLKTAISTIIQNVSPELIRQFDDGLDISSWINNIVGEVKDNPEISNALVGLFSINEEEIPLDEAKTIVDRYINYIAKLLGEDPTELKMKLGFEDVDTLYARYKDVAKKAAEKISGESGGKKYLSIYEDLDKFARDNNINTSEEVDAWEKILQEVNKLPDSFDKASEAKKRYLETDVTNETPTLSISDTIDLLNTQLKPAFDSLQSAYQKIFTIEDGKEIFTLENVDLSMFKDIQSSIEELNKAGLNIDVSSYDDFVKTLSDSSSTADEVKSAFNNVATTVTNSLSPSLSQASGEQYLLIQSMLESLGIMNSEAVMIDSLGYSYEEYIAAKENATQAGFDLANATDEEIANFVYEQLAADNCGEALAILQLKKLLVNSAKIDMNADIQQILALANAANITSSSLVSLANAKANFDAAVASGDKQGMALAARGIKDAVKGAEDEILNFKAPEIDFNGNSGSKAAGKAGKEAANEYLEAFEKELSKLDDLKNRGKITEKQYLDALRKLYVKYFRQKEKYIDEMAKYENQYLQGKHTCPLLQ